MQTTIPSTSSAYASLFRADLTTLWRNRRGSLITILVPVIILVSWKPLIAQFGAAFVLSNCITIGTIAVGLIGYSNSIARDRDKGILQRLRVAPAPNWIIMISRISVQLLMIIIVTAMLFIIGYQYDKITLSFPGYVFGFATAIVGGAVYLSLGQIVVGLITNPETVNATTRLIYFAFLSIGLFGEFGALGKEIGDIVKWSPYGTVKRVVSAALQPANWNAQTSMALLATLGYILVFSFLGIKWFRWNTAR